MLRNFNRFVTVLSSVCTVILLVISVFTVVVCYELPYQEAAREYSTAVSMTSMTGESMSLERIGFVYSAYVRFFVWFAALAVPPLFLFRTMNLAFRKRMKKYWRKIK